MYVGVCVGGLLPGASERKLLRPAPASHARPTRAFAALAATTASSFRVISREFPEIRAGGFVRVDTDIPPVYGRPRLCNLDEVRAVLGAASPHVAPHSVCV